MPSSTGVTTTATVLRQRSLGRKRKRPRSNNDY
jgi:hypothetical protein